MRRTAWLHASWWIGLGSVSILLSALCGCSWKDVFSPHLTTLSNAEAVDRALQLCSITAGDRPFHLILNIAPPSAASASESASAAAMRAQIEVFWINPITYRTEIRSPSFNQTRIVNGRVVEEHNSGDFYPRWIQNFVDAILEPVPDSAQLRKVPGSIPVGVESHACITGASAQICFQNAEPRIASGSNAYRSVWFGDFAPFGQQQIARTLADKLPGDLLVRGKIVLLAPLSQDEYLLTKAKEYTPPDKYIQTEPVTEATAESLLQVTPANFPPKRKGSQTGRISPIPPASGESRAGVYIRTDRTGKVREAYPDNSSASAAQEDAVARALSLHFKPLVVDGVPRQMEATVAVPR